MPDGVAGRDKRISARVADGARRRGFGGEEERQAVEAPFPWFGVYRDGGRTDPRARVVL